MNSLQKLLPALLLFLAGFASLFGSEYMLISRNELLSVPLIGLALLFCFLSIRKVFFAYANDSDGAGKRTALAVLVTIGVGYGYYSMLDKRSVTTNFEDLKARNGHCRTALSETAFSLASGLFSPPFQNTFELYEDACRATKFLQSFKVSKSNWCGASPSEPDCFRKSLQDLAQAMPFGVTGNGLIRALGTKFVVNPTHDNLTRQIELFDWLLLSLELPEYRHSWISDVKTSGDKKSLHGAFFADLFSRIAEATTLFGALKKIEEIQNEIGQEIQKTRVPASDPSAPPSSPSELELKFQPLKERYLKIVAKYHYQDYSPEKSKDEIKAELFRQAEEIEPGFSQTIH